MFGLTLRFGVKQLDQCPVFTELGLLRRRYQFLWKDGEFNFEQVSFITTDTTNLQLSYL